MSESLEIVLVRHGESVRNLSCDLARSGNHTELQRQMVEDTVEEAWPLTDLGHEQAKVTGAWLRNRYGTEFLYAGVSTFLRARETAEDLGLGLAWQADARLREREWGDYCAEGFAPYTVDQYLQHLAECAVFDWRSPFPGAESLADLVPRTREYLTDFLRTRPTGRAIFVSHGGTVRALQLTLERLRPDQHAHLPPARLSNCCVMTFRLRDVDPEAMTWTGERHFAAPVLAGAPEQDWQPIVGPL